MDMPKEFYELTKRGHATSDRNEKIEIIRNLEEMAKTEDSFGPYKMRTLLQEIHDLKIEANVLIIGNILDKHIFNPRFIKKVMSAASLESKLIEEIVETNPTFSLVKYMIENIGNDLSPSPDMSEVWRVRKKKGERVEIYKGGYGYNETTVYKKED